MSFESKPLIPYKLLIMIAKKNSRVDLERKRIILFNIGLLTAGAFTLAAFTYSEPIVHQKDKMEVVATEIDLQVEYEQPNEASQNQTNAQKDNNREQQNNIGSETSITRDINSTTNKNTRINAGVGSDGPPGVSFPVLNPGKFHLMMKSLKFRL